MINFLNLEYFLVAAEELNFTKAARKLYISQQSLSNHIANLEKEFDVVLFNRTSPLTLTYAGQALQSRARALLDMRDETYKEIADIKDFSTGQISIGVSHTRGRIILPEIHSRLSGPFPRYRPPSGRRQFQRAGLRPAPREHRSDDRPSPLRSRACGNRAHLPGRNPSGGAGFRSGGLLSGTVRGDPGKALSRLRHPPLRALPPFILLKKRKPGAYHCRRDLRGRPDHPQDHSGNRKHRNRTGPLREKVWESPSTPKCSCSPSPCPRPGAILPARAP